LPSDWKDYSVNDLSRKDQPGSILAFELPTNDPNWLKINERKGIVFAIHIISEADAVRIGSECKKSDSAILCLIDDEKIGQNNMYTFYLNLGPRDEGEYPNDFPSLFYSKISDIVKTLKFTN
jgi:hypothetical protein